MKRWILFVVVIGLCMFSQLVPTVTSAEEFPGFLGYWTKYWNVCSYYAKTDEWDTILWDGFYKHFDNMKESGDKVYFYYEGTKRYIYKKNLSQDPRRTQWWQQWLKKRHESLQEAVEEMALTGGVSDEPENFPPDPNMTEMILWHIYHTFSGEVNTKNAKTMEEWSRSLTEGQVNQLLKKYTLKAYTNEELLDALQRR